jgi:hypothetical protein
MNPIRHVVPLLLIVAAASPAEARTPPASRSTAQLTVVPAGSEQALKSGRAIISRPFGAQLVDRLWIDGRYSVGKDRLYLVRGTAGADCPARYLIVAQRPGEAPAVSAPFGTCGAGASGQVVQGKLVVTVAAAPGSTGSIRYLYNAGAISPLDAASAVAITASADPVTCRAYKAATDGSVADMIDRSLPAAYRRAGDLRRTDISPDTMRDVVADLACLAMLPEGSDLVPSSATEMFASRRHGKAAYAALDQVARAPQTAPDLRAAVRSLSAQMHYYVARRSPL